MADTPLSAVMGKLVEQLNLLNEIKMDVDYLKDLAQLCDEVQSLMNWPNPGGST